MAYALSGAVGLNDDGSFCTNTAQDQQQVAELLLQVALPWGGLRTSTGPVVTIPSPFVDGAVSAELVGAIQSFQTIQSASLNIDLRVEPNGPTWLLLVQLAAAPSLPTQALAVVVLDAIGLTVEEAAPPPVSGLPSLVYTPAASAEQLVFDNGAVRVTATFSGTITGSWGASIGPACVASPSIYALERAVASGDVRRLGATALDQACNELRAQTRFAANGLFSSVAIAWDGVGAFRVSGSLGDQWRQLSIGLELPNTLIATGSITVSEAVPLPALGSAVNFSGTMAMTIKVMLRDPSSPDEASLLANVAAVFVAGAIVLGPLAAWIAGATSAAAASPLVESAAAGVVGERVLLGPSPGL